MSDNSAASPPKIHRASLGRWVLWRLALLLLCVGGLFLWLAQHILESRFDSFDAEVYRQELLRVDIALEQNQLALEKTIADYAYWDDAEQFIQGNNPDFVADNFTPDSMRNIEVHAMLITGLDAIPLTSLQLEEIPDELLPLLLPMLGQLAPTDARRVSTTLQWLKGHAFLVSAVPVTDTQGERSPSGYLYFVRALHGAVLTRLRSLTLVPFELQPVGMQTEPLTVARRDTQSGPVWQVSQKLSRLAAQIRVGGPTHLSDERRITNMTMAAGVLVLSLCSLLGIYLILHHRILNRLQLFSALADRHRQQQDHSIRWPESGRDELDNLAGSLNELLAEVETRHNALSYLADHDPLTGLGNRRLLMARLNADSNRLRRSLKLPSCLLLLDLDDFKLINDGLGHTAGDDVLKLIAERMRKQIRNYDTAARLGGDEFAILLEELDPLAATEFAHRLLDAITEPYDYHGQSLSFRASVGLAVVDASVSKEDVLRNADLAMYEAKRRGKGQVVLFDVGLLDETSRRMQLEQALKISLNEQGLEVWFQPILDADTDTVVGMEALCRWPFAGRYIPPGEFIAIAEACGVITQLGQFVLDKAGAALQILRQEHPHLQCNINLSVRQFRDAALVADIHNCAKRYGLPASALHLELTESMVAESETDILPTMKQLVALGYQFHLDDFGTGYSSLERLRELPFRTLKIDRSFVQPLGTGDDVMVRNIINIGRELGMELIAEGVETETELVRLRQLGCHLFQGYYYAKPMPLHEFEHWLQTRKLSTQTYTVA
jgi:diguanylate cyclase (GGDEF)-like protein